VQFLPRLGVWPTPAKLAHARRLLYAILLAPKPGNVYIHAQ